MERVDIYPTEETLWTLRAASILNFKDEYAPIGAPWRTLKLHKCQDDKQVQNSSVKWELPLLSTSSILENLHPDVEEMLVALGLISDKLQLSTLRNQSKSDNLIESITHICPSVVGLYDNKNVRLNYHEGYVCLTSLRLIWVSIVPDKQLELDFKEINKDYSKNNDEKKLNYRDIQINPKYGTISVVTSKTYIESKVQLSLSPPKVYYIPLSSIKDIEIFKGIWKLSSPKILIDVLDIPNKIVFPSLYKMNDQPDQEANIYENKMSNWICDICENENDIFSNKCALCGASRIVNKDLKDLSAKYKIEDVSSTSVWRSWEEEMSRYNEIKLYPRIKLSFRSGITPNSTYTSIKELSLQKNINLDVPSWCVAFVETTLIDITAGRIPLGNVRKIIKNKSLIENMTEEDINSLFIDDNKTKHGGISQVLRKFEYDQMALKKDALSAFDNLKLLTTKLDMLIGMADDIRNKVYDDKTVDSGILNFSKDDKQLAKFRIFISDLKTKHQTIEDGSPEENNVVNPKLKESLEMRDLVDIGNNILVNKTKLKTLSTDEIEILKDILSIITAFNKSIMICADLWCVVNKVFATSSSSSVRSTGLKKRYISPKLFMKLTSVISAINPKNENILGFDNILAYLGLNNTKQSIDFMNLSLGHGEKIWIRRRFGNTRIDVVHNSKYINSEIFKRINVYLNEETNSNEHCSSLNFGNILNAAFLSEREDIPVPIAFEILCICENSGILCRDESLHGTFFYKNIF